MEKNFDLIKMGILFGLKSMEAGATLLQSQRISLTWLLETRTQSFIK